MSHLLSCDPSASLTIWASSWLAGSSAPDDVIGAMHALAPMHLVAADDPVTAEATGLPWPQPEDRGVAALLWLMRGQLGQAPAPDSLRLVLPVPGDVRGLPARTTFAEAALTAGAGLLIRGRNDRAPLADAAPGAGGLGLVPSVEGPDVLTWTVFTIADGTRGPDQMSIGEAEFAMREAVRGAAQALAELETIQPAPGAAARAVDPRARIAELMAERGHHSYPTSTPARAMRVLDSAAQVEAILAIAQDDSAGSTQSASAAYRREALLQPLWSSVRVARLAAVNDCVRLALGARQQ